MAKGYTVIQQDNDRYVFVIGKYTSGAPFYKIVHEHCMTTGSSVSYQVVSRDYGNQFYLTMMEKGFKQFRNAREVSWYATTEYNPIGEKWTTEGKYLIPLQPIE